MQIDYVKLNEHGFLIGWNKEGVGFGELAFSNDKQELDVECMSEEFCKEVFSAFVEKYYPEKFKNKK